MRHVQKYPTVGQRVAAGHQLLLTKLYLPPAHRELVLRPAVLAKLAAGLAGPLTLVSAPPGFGKTTLLSAWHASPEGGSYRLGWLSLDRDDDDLVRFLQYLIAALDTVQRGIGTQAAKMLRSPQPPPAKAVLACLLNKLVALTDDFVLVLNDIMHLKLSDSDVEAVVARTEGWVAGLQDQTGTWYRHHHLFRDLLRARLHKLHPGDVRTLHRRASQWHEAEGLIPEAVKHAFLTKDFTYAADVVERWGMWVLMPRVALQSTRQINNAAMPQSAPGLTVAFRKDDPDEYRSPKS